MKVFHPLMFTDVQGIFKSKSLIHLVICAWCGFGGASFLCQRGSNCSDTPLENAAFSSVNFLSILLILVYLSIDFLFCLTASLF